MQDGANIIFTANDGTDGTEEWITGGTAATTVRLDPGAVGSPLYSNPVDVTNVAGGVFVFAATDATSTNIGTELYVTGSTPGTTKLLKDIDPGTGSSDPGNFIASGAGNVFFTANDGTDGTEEWMTRMAQRRRNGAARPRSGG